VPEPSHSGAVEPPVAVLDEDVDGPAAGTPDLLPDPSDTERLEWLAPRVREAFAGPAPFGELGVATDVGPRRFGDGPVTVFRPGETAEEVSVDRAELERLLRAALSLSDAPSLIWVSGDNELAVHPHRARIALGSGTLVVGLPVECDQTGPAELTVPFALGSDELAAGVVMATPPRPDGPGLLVEQWGAVVVAAVYRALLDLLSAAAAAAGLDRDGRPLLPGAVSSDGERLRLVPQARHAIDRRRLL
jgi:hypothetical protein